MVRGTMPPQANFVQEERGLHTLAHGILTKPRVKCENDEEDDTTRHLGPGRTANVVRLS